MEESTEEGWEDVPQRLRELCEKSQEIYGGTGIGAS